MWYDQDKLEKIVSNILFNAFKFTTAEGTVNLSIHISDEHLLTIKVEDSGKGIHEDDIKHVFSPFYQSKNLADDGQPGTGLGLSLVNELVRLHNGTIEISSKPGAGTAIIIYLPVRKSKLEYEREITPEFSNHSEILNRTSPLIEVQSSNEVLSVHDETILVVEDNPELREFIASSFRDNYHVITANDGEEGLQIAIEQVPDLIISDVMMPNMDGLTLTDKLKNDERSSHIPVILLTAKADVNSRLEGFRTGADDYLAKPFFNRRVIGSPQKPD